MWNNAKPYWMTVEGSEATHGPRNPVTCAVSRDDGDAWELVQDLENRVGYESGYLSVSFFGDEAFVGYYSNVNSGPGIVSEVKLKIFPITWFYKADTERV